MPRGRKNGPNNKYYCESTKKIVNSGIMRMLVSWIGNADLRAPDSEDKADVGPIAQALEAQHYNRVVLLADQEAKALRKYEGWLRSKIVKKAPASLSIERVELTSPTNFDQIYSAVTRTLDLILRDVKETPQLTFHLSPGTPAMAATWVILGKTRYRAELIQSSRQRGVEVASVPFNIALSPEFVTDVLRIPDKQLEKLSSGVAEEAAQFGDMIYRGVPMQRLVSRAKKAAPRSVPILIEGESGTGKELLARAIHAASPRSNKSLRIVNCGAIPAQLIESELFGHEKGAFTGALQAHAGYFEDADGGTLFLDEIGELPLSAQVKFLRVLQEGEVTRVGATRPRKIAVRIIAATNRDLMTEVALGHFREDLFFRLAVLVLKVPPLRDREGDLGPLIDGMLKRVNDASSGDPGYKHKKLSADAKNILLQHRWPGNVRELQNTLQRAAVWADGEKISATDIQEAILPSAQRGADDGVLNRSLEENGLDLQSLITEVERHYIRRALEAAHGSKTQAAKLLGLGSYQTFTNWAKRCGVE
jgi:DNA-binding NtrC family response regulator